MFASQIRRTIVLLGLVLGPTVPAAISEDRIEFNRDIRPILSDKCFYCHGPDANHRMADLRLDLREDALASGVIAPSDPDSSVLIDRIFAADDSIMPPADSNKRLSEHEKELLRRWIEQGATFQKHWAYEPIIKPDIPAGEHPIDYLVGKQLSRVGLEWSPPADHRTLLRRMYADFIGLPPAPDLVDSLVGEPIEEVMKQCLEELIRNPHYGERMALAWLDVVRYADTIGYHSDNPRNVWPYRDYVIQSFQNNKPFDQFTIEQLAGDLLPQANQETRVGSAFNRLLLTTEEGGAQAADYQERMLADRVRAVGTVWLGQTTGCAQCHDHKFDPITMRDFYSLGAFFADIKEPILGPREEGMLVTTVEQAEQLQSYQRAIDQLKRDLETAVESERDTLRSRLDALTAEYNQFRRNIPKCLVSVSSPNRRIVRIRPRGNWMDDSGEILAPAFPAFLRPNESEDSDKLLTRLDLAQWLVARDNPLTSRTVMNRLWKHFFGTGISRVLDDLGGQGDPPTNGPLLDWLAAEFMDSGWNWQQMVRWIVTSRTYQQTSFSSQKHLELDPLNRFYGRQNSFRMDAELVRDYVLDVSGILNKRIGGPSIKPYQPDGYWDNINFPPRKYVADSDPKLQHRRGIYIWWQRSFLHPSLLAFDAPSREECVAERMRSNIPQQALVLLNDPIYVEPARAFAARIVALPNASIRERICWAWKQALQRSPDPIELEMMTQLVEAQSEIYASNPESAKKVLSVGIVPIPEDIDSAELAAWHHVARVLFNLHEFITRS